MSIIFWDPKAIANGETYSSNDWDTCWLGDLQLPGLVDVRCNPQREVDKKKRHGSDGAKITVYGYLPSEVVISVLIWTKDQWEAWQKCAPIIWPGPGKLPADAFPIRHPQTALWQINAVYVISPSSSTKGPVDQSKVWALKCVEQFEGSKKNTTKTQKGAKQNVALAKTFQGLGAQNAGTAPPSQTDTGPRGPKKKPAGGAF